METSRIDTFQTKRLVAERLRSSHLPDYVRLFQDPRVMATLSPDGKPLPTEEAARWLGLTLEHWDRHGYGFWAIRHKADNAFVGRAGLKSTRVSDKDEVELAYALLPEFWGQGLATEISRAILRLAFDEVRLTDVICFTLTTNVASERVMQKLGFRFEREGPHADLPHVFYRLRAGDLPASAAAKEH